MQETEKDQESDNKEGEEKKDECNTCKNDQEVVFIQVRERPTITHQTRNVNNRFLL